MENQEVVNEIVEETKKNFFENVTKEGVAIGATMATILLAGGYLVKNKAKKLVEKAKKIVEKENEAKEKKKEEKKKD